jgi:SAM-dependent methyltransferase
MSGRDHWDRIYGAKAPAELSWYESVPVTSLRLIDAAGLPPGARLLDVGGGASTLVDALLDRGDIAVSVLDLSWRAIERARLRLGARAPSVTWLEGDVLRVELPPEGYDLWHDRALFHFLTESRDREAYIGKMLGSVRPGGHLVMATFAADGPVRCSGLPVVRYSPGDLGAELGDSFELLEHEHVGHRTPGGTVQRFLFARFLRR